MIETESRGKRSVPELAKLYLKGAAMGAADAVPGVSGGTIAFISGIYEELVNAIRSFGIHAIRLLFKGDLKGAWAHVNGTFLLFLFAGIGTSLLLFSRMILWLLIHYPVLVWAFFFGLIAASALVISRSISQKNHLVLLCGLAGVGLGYFITVAVPAQTPETPGFVFLAGMIAICAMILPGISGSFILVLLSKYEYVFTAIKEWHFAVILVFGAGCATGLLSFSHLLNWTLKRYYNATIALLTGLMIGSLNKVWPWKKVLETYATPSGEIRPLIEENILPFSYLDLTGQPPYILWACGLAVIGFLMVYYLEKLSRPETAAGDIEIM